MSMRDYRGEVAAKIMAGLVANPSIIQCNDRSGWGLVNCTDSQLAGYAVRLADQIIRANESIPVPSIEETKT